VRVPNIQTPAFVTGLADLASAYRALLCDIWGVVHNGVQAYPAATDALARYRAEGGLVLLITNAPRGKGGILEMFDRMGVSPEAYDDILSSGDVARDVLAERIGKRIYHLGPERDLSIYDGLPHVFGDVHDCEIVSCTGFFDDETETPDDYQEQLVEWRARDVPMVCANPDIVIERGGRMVFCAGAIAERYRALGGETIMVGKPHALVYEAALKRIADLSGEIVLPQSVLAIGDAVETDVRGAVGQGIDVLFVTGGIHAADFGDRDAPDLARVHANLAAAGLGARAVVPRLTWGGGA
jgi:HAD superfamily hydrolase (TIGR01459 family)